MRSVAAIFAAALMASPAAADPITVNAVQITHFAGAGGSDDNFNDWERSHLLEFTLPR